MAAYFTDQRVFIILDKYTAAIKCLQEMRKAFLGKIEIKVAQDRHKKPSNLKMFPSVEQCWMWRNSSGLIIIQSGTCSEFVL